MNNLPPDIAIRWITFVPDEAARWEALITSDEYERMHAFRIAKRRQEFLAGRVAARTLLAERRRGTTWRVARINRTCWY